MLLRILLLCGLCFGAQAATVTGNMVDSGFGVWGTRVRFQPYSQFNTPAFLTVSNKTVVPVPVPVNVTNGAFSVSLVGGWYQFDAGSPNPLLTVLVPLNDTNTYTLNDVARLAVNAAMFAGSNITVTVTGGGGITNNQFLPGLPVLNLASATNLSASSIIGAVAQAAHATNADSAIGVYSTSSSSSVFLVSTNTTNAPFRIVGAPVNDTNQHTFYVQVLDPSGSGNPGLSLNTWIGQRGVGLDAVYSALGSPSTMYEMGCDTPYGMITYGGKFPWVHFATMNANPSSLVTSFYPKGFQPFQFVASDLNGTGGYLNLAEPYQPGDVGHSEGLPPLRLSAWQADFTYNTNYLASAWGFLPLEPVNSHGTPHPMLQIGTIADPATGFPVSWLQGADQSTERFTPLVSIDRTGTIFANGSGLTNLSGNNIIPGSIGAGALGNQSVDKTNLNGAAGAYIAQVAAGAVSNAPTIYNATLLGGQFSGNAAGMTNVPNVWLPVANTNVLILSGFGAGLQTITNDGNDAYIAGPTIDASGANGAYYWNATRHSYTNASGYGVYYESSYTGVSWLTNAAFPLTVDTLNDLGSGIAAEGNFGDIYASPWFQGDANTIYPGADSYYQSNLVQVISNNLVGGGVALKYVGDGSGLSGVQASAISALADLVTSNRLAQVTVLTNPIFSRMQTNSAALTNGSLNLPTAFQGNFNQHGGKDLGGAIGWYTPTNPTALGFVTTFEHWGSSPSPGDQWMQLGAQNIRLEPGWGPVGGGGGEGMLMLGNELAYTEVTVNYSLATNRQGLAVGSPLTFSVRNTNASQYALPGIIGTFDPNVTGPFNDNGVMPGNLVFYSLSPEPHISVRGAIDANAIATATMHTNNWEFNYSVLIDSNAPPAAPTSYGQSCIWNSNGYATYGIQGSRTSLAWSRTNYMFGIDAAHP